jgi:hypothetical protein
MRSRVLALALVVVVAAGLATVGRPLLPRWELHVTGVVRGERLDATPGQNAPNATDAVRAEVRCNGVSAQAAPDGSYSLAVPLAARYTCTAASPPTYAPQRVDLPEDDAGSIQINFGGSSDQCAYASGLPVLSCPPLKLAPGSITGHALAPDGGAASGVEVKCGLAGAQAALDGLHPAASATTDASGAFTLASLHPGDYDCLASSAAGGAQAQQAHVAPGQTASLRLALCVRNCPPVRYHGGLVMHTFTAYLIFWLPKGYSFEPGTGGDDARYQALITQYFRDIGETPYYGLLTQYFDYRGPVQNTVTLGGVYNDINGYQHCTPLGGDCHAAAATQSDPLTDDDVAAEVGRALKNNPDWHIGSDTEFFVYTGAGVEECAGAKLSADCTFKDHDHSFCAYHTAAASSLASVPTLYAFVPDPASHQNGCALGSSPNGDVIADSAIDFSAHEQFESVTNPVQLSDKTGAWFDDTQRTTGRNEGEIADKCADNFGRIASDGGNITLANGHRYLVQAMWSNSAGGCVFQ